MATDVGVTVEIPSCGTCRHWGTEDQDDEGEVFRTCNAVIHDYRSYAGADPEDYPEESRAEILAVQRAAAVVVDGSGYHAALKCREDFGCRLWQQKPATQGEPDGQEER